MPRPGSLTPEAALVVGTDTGDFELIQAFFLDRDQLDALAREAPFTGEWRKNRIDPGVVEAAEGNRGGGVGPAPDPTNPR